MLSEQLQMLQDFSPMQVHGSVLEVKGLAVHVVDLPSPVGAMVRIESAGYNQHSIFGQIVGFNHDLTIVMPMGGIAGVRPGDLVVTEHTTQAVGVGPSLLGRVLDGMGRPIDHLGPLGQTVHRPLNPPAIEPMGRPMIKQPLATGIRAIDALISVGKGQRLGIFAQPGVGKSILLGQMARMTDADVSVVALVGERGREVRDFIENYLGKEGLAKSVVVCATGDEPALLRLRAAMVATTVAEYFRDQGASVLLIMDSVTRFCQAQRQIGLAAGEPPATRGYPPSVFSMLPKLLERSGQTESGSITGLYAVLVEGDESTDPIADACRGVLDGHIGLSKEMASQGHWPAIDLNDSISRVSHDVTDTQHQQARAAVIELTYAYKQVQDLLNIGAYASGSNDQFDMAIACKPAIDKLVRQGLREQVTGDFARTRSQLMALNELIGSTQRQLTKVKKQMLRSAGT